MASVGSSSAFGGGSRGKFYLLSFGFSGSPLISVVFVLAGCVCSGRGEVHHHGPAKWVAGRSLIRATPVGSPGSSRLCWRPSQSARSPDRRSMQAMSSRRSRAPMVHRKVSIDPVFSARIRPQQAPVRSRLSPRPGPGSTRTDRGADHHDRGLAGCSARARHLDEVRPGGVVIRSD